MNIRIVAHLAPVFLLAACCNQAPQQASPTPHAIPLAELQSQAARFQNLMRVPEYDTSPDMVRNSLDAAISGANAALDRIGSLRPSEVTFANTVAAIDHLLLEPNNTANRLSLVKETSRDPAVREAATGALKKFSEWAVGLEYREDVYAAVKALADAKPALAGEEAKLLEEILRDYKRAGLGLPKSERDEVERLRKQLANLTTDFESNINKARGPVKFSKAELAGVPEAFLSQEGIKTGDDEYTLQANITFHFMMVLENANSEAVRKRFSFVHESLAKDSNSALLRQILELRHKIAARLGYASWADYQTETKMAKTATNAIRFLEDLKQGLQPKLDAEMASFRALKVKETGDPNAQVHLWDWRYYANQLKKEKYNVDAEQLRDFFPLDRTLNGMFAIYEKIFGVKYARVEPPARWVDDLQLWSVSDAKTGEPLGLFYLDLYPRDGKYNHFAVFGLIEGRQLADGRYQRPTVAMVCNFPPPQPGKPSLLAHEEVLTLFHEFGHVMHSMLTRARFARFSGSNVERDFVEAPSQMLEYWAFDKNVLDTFAADYRDPNRKIPSEILSQLKAAELATKGTWYRRQISFGLLDLALHTQVREGSGVEPIELSNRILGECLLPMQEGSAFAAYFGHLVHYDAGYYGYAWADVISADMADVFEKSPGGYFDTTTGLRLRNEIYAVGSSRNPNVSIEAFLRRAQSKQPFLNKIGLGDR